MQNIIEGGATNNLHNQKILVAKNLSVSDKELLKNFGKRLKDTNSSKFGETNGGLGRRVAIIPMDIMNELERIEPDLFKSKEKLLKFLEQFPIFKAADRL